MLLTLKRRAGARLVLSPSLAYRAGFALIFAVSLFVAFFGSLFEGEPTPFAPANIAPLLFVLASGLALLYCDAWIFDRDGGVVENQFGLLLLCRRRSILLREIRSIGMESFKKGRAGAIPHNQDRDTGLGETRRRGIHSRIDRLVARDAQGVAHVLDMARGARTDALRRTGTRIAEFCGVPFEEA